MQHARGACREGWNQWVVVAAAVGTLLLTTDSCRGSAGPFATSLPAVLRVGVAQLSATNPNAGLRQLSQIIAVEGLARLGDDGRVEPWVADKWRSADGGRSLIVTLKPGVKFHDGTPVDPSTLAAALPDALRSALGPVFEEIDHVRPVDATSIEIGFRRASPLFLEALEAQVRKPGRAIVATGPFMIEPDSTTDLRANADYYLGPPLIGRLHIETFPSVRMAWAELLRNRLDMLYEVGPDALDSLETATSVAVFKFTRRYQYLIALNTRARPLRSAAVRRALNLAVDRDYLVRQALKGHGVPSSGPIWPRHWALGDTKPSFEFAPREAAQILNGSRPVKSHATDALHFTLLIPSDAVYERIALELKRQLETVGVDMAVEAATQDQLFEAEKNRTYDAILIEGISGPTIMRPYQLWHSAGTMNEGGFGNAIIDAAFENLREAETEDRYRAGIRRLQQAFVDDPPAIFLAWSERARAVSKRFDVPPTEPGRDVLATLRLWVPHNDDRVANRN